MVAVQVTRVLTVKYVSIQYMLLTESEAPLDMDMGSHASTVEIEELDKTITVPNSLGVSVQSDEKWTIVWRKRSKR